MTLGSQGSSAKTSTASAPPTPQATIPRTTRVGRVRARADHKSTGECIVLEDNLKSRPYFGARQWEIIKQVAGESELVAARRRTLANAESRRAKLGPNANEVINDEDEFKDGHIAISSEVMDTAAQLISENTDTLYPIEADRYVGPISAHAPYRIQIMDKTTLESAAILGIRLGTVFYVSYPVFNTTIFIWGATLTMHAACEDFAQLFVACLLLGMCEGSIMAGLMIVSSMFLLMNGTELRALNHGNGRGFRATDTHSVISYVRLVTITGVMTFLPVMVYCLHFPDSPTNAWFLTNEECMATVQRLKYTLFSPSKASMLSPPFHTETTGAAWPRAMVVPSLAFTYLQTTLLGCVDGIIKIVTIWMG
ncbi:uncharacterized protein LAESUDRAFT_751752, partial [Laetiporus sulphureus 93-53]